MDRRLTIPCGPYAHKPAQRQYAWFVYAPLPGGASADSQGVSEVCVVISQPLFKPGPVWLGDFVEDRLQPPGQLFADILGEPATVQPPAKIFVKANQAECPSPRRSEVRDGWQRLREQLFGHPARTPMRRAHRRGAQRPNRPARTI